MEIAGEGNPKGRLYHTCFGSKNELNVVDIWDSIENFNKFGQTLIPILQSLGIDPGQPEINEVHNIIEGNESASENLSFAKRIYSFFNERKFDEAVLNVSEDLVIHNMAQNIQIHGKEGFLQFMNFWVTAFPDAKTEIKNMVADGDYVITQLPVKERTMVYLIPQ